MFNLVFEAFNYAILEKLVAMNCSEIVALIYFAILALAALLAVMALLCRLMIIAF